jgi:hypothetical protein
MNNHSTKLGIAFGISIILLCLSVNPSIGLSNKDDTTPPVTSIFFDPPNPDGENGWFVSNVTVTLIATDDISGVNVTYFRINEGDWQIYENPFVISKDGEDIPIEYYSIDNAGNHEDVQRIFLDIDKCPPIIYVSIKIVGGNCWKGWDIEITISACENMSGMERVEIFFNNELQETISGSGPEYVWTLRFWPIPKAFFRVCCYDFAGNICCVTLDVNELLFNSSIKISGPRFGRPGVEYEYTFLIKSPNGSDYLLYIDWGDGTFTDWLGPYVSEEPLKISHAWPKNGTYEIIAKVRNLYGCEFLEESFKTFIIREKSINNLQINSFLGRFIILERMFNFLRLILF